MVEGVFLSFFHRACFWHPHVGMLCGNLTASLSLQGSTSPPLLLMLLCASGNAPHALTGAIRARASHIVIVPPFDEKSSGAQRWVQIPAIQRETGYPRYNLSIWIAPFRL